MSQAEAGSVAHPSEGVSEAILENRPATGWVATLLEWGAVPRLISLLDWPNQSDTRPWPGAYAAAGDCCSIPAKQHSGR
jgi:hypothetical protein